MLRPVVFVPLIHRDEVAFWIAGRAGRGIEGGAILCAIPEAVGHLVEDFQDAELGAVLAIFLFDFAFWRWGKSPWCILLHGAEWGDKKVVPGALSLPIRFSAQVEMEIKSIQFTSNFKSTLLIPYIWWPGYTSASNHLIRWCI
jgi:hypothetical protein